MTGAAHSEEGGTQTRSVTLVGDASLGPVVDVPPAPRPRRPKVAVQFDDRGFSEFKRKPPPGASRVRRDRRNRFPKALPRVPEDSTFAAGDKQYEAGRPDPGWLTNMIVTTSAGKNEVAAAVERAESAALAAAEEDGQPARRGQKRSPKRAYSDAELESVYLLRLMARKRHMSETREWLAVRVPRSGQDLAVHG